MLNLIRFWSVAMMTVLLSTGCYRDFVAPGELVEIQGEIYLDDRPVPEATILFVPENIKQTDQFLLSYGKTNSRGEFELWISPDKAGALVGKHRVFISRRKNGNEDSLGFEPIENPSDVPKIINQSINLPDDELIPFYYNVHSELICEVVPGRGIQRMKIDLTSVDPLIHGKPIDH